MLGIVAFLLVGETRQIVALRLEEEDGIDQPDPIDDESPFSGSDHFVPGQSVDSVEQVDDS